MRAARHNLRRCGTVALNRSGLAAFGAEWRCDGQVRRAGCLGVCFLRYCLDGLCLCCAPLTRSLDDGAWTQVRADRSDHKFRK